MQISMIACRPALAPEEQSMHIRRVPPVFRRNASTPRYDDGAGAFPAARKARYRRRASYFRFAYFFLSASYTQGGTNCSISPPIFEISRTMELDRYMYCGGDMMNSVSSCGES